ncbi:molybdenum cofactor guanylyltransferase [Aporhodopirellula aestuarii]|uniref:Molybdenum cofactor guanylyltransferase n=1 Tax=Aporhodopirellula aestuarii TaxID=2950107 RepID=A0ABT0U3X5_9BACT|nr:molybdenum cofactor guanylyltransferase [Aporhodopirellula aestuarii]MCM2371623.1 molybdenum cofactor guanylyltransferase [Aporhodopirellula aestuarii]
MNDRPQQILGVVLAGGRSSRMGRCKAELPHPDGGTFLQHAIGQLSAVCDQIAVSLAADASEVALPDSPDLHTVVDSRPDCGPAEGVSRSLELVGTLRCTGALFTPVDVPRLKAEHLGVLLRQFESTPDRIVCAVTSAIATDDSSVGSLDKTLQPLIAVYPLGMLAELTSLARSHRRSLYRFIQTIDHVTVGLPADVLHNVNSPADLHP